MMKTLLMALSASLIALPVAAQVSDEAAEAMPEIDITMEEATTIQADDRVVGEADAANELIIYASVTCPHCGEWFTQEWPEVKASLIGDGKLRVALREFPTAPAPVSIAGFMVANCGAEENWYPTVEMQFEGQEATFAALEAGEGQQRITEFAKVAGLETEEEIKACFAENDAAFARIERNMMRAEAAGLTGVPAFYLNGEKLGGEHTSEAIGEALN